MPKIREILCLHHTHLDVGYTHVQPALLQLHIDFIDEAIGLCEKTQDWPEESKFRWTCETTLPVLRWLEVATPENVARFARFLGNGQIGIAAQLLHATPLADAEQIARMLQPVRTIRERFGAAVDVSINHDVNGQPWPMSQILLDAGVRMHVTGINTHFGGFPLKRPYLFRWRTPDGRDILAFNGEIYVLFNWMFEPQRNDLDFMRTKLDEYTAKLEAEGYPHDFIFLTATNPPSPDNNGPDHELADLFRRWNDAGNEPKMKFATPAMLLERCERIPRETIPVHAGDWTDYWNFGSGSTAKVTRLFRKARQGIRTADLLESALGCPSPQYRQASDRARTQLDLYTEHTWGHSHNVEAPDRPDVEEGWHHKAHYAYDASGLATYLLGSQLEALAGNPKQSGPPEGVLVLNPSSVTQFHSLQVPREFLRQGRHLASQRMEMATVSKDREDREADCVDFGEVEVPAFSWKRIPFSGLPATRPGQGASATENTLENAFHRLEFDPSTGRVLGLWDKALDRQFIDTTSEWSFFQYVQETIDPTHNLVSRKTFYEGSRGGWNPEWKGLRRGADRLLECRAETNAKGATLVLRWDAPGAARLEQRITLFHSRAGVGCSVLFDKTDVRSPEGIYFAFPLKLDAWRCHFDTAGQFVELDAEQLPGVCRDWVTVDRTVSVHDAGTGAGITLACPDAPLVQVGGFRFGRHSGSVEREPNPLLLAWPMNNYWETNFPAKQPGLHRLDYEFSTFARFDPVEAFRAGATAAMPTVSTAAVRCPTPEEGRLCRFEGDGIVPLSLSASEDGRSAILLAGNLRDAERSLTCTFPGRTVGTVFETDMLGKDTRELPRTEGPLVLTLGAGALRRYRIELRSDVPCADPKWSQGTI